MFIFLVTVAGLSVFYNLYQLARNKAVLEIRLHWIATHDPRIYQYSYDDMLNPSRSNMFGLQWPADENFKDKESDEEA